MSHYTSNKASVIMQKSFINNSQQLFDIYINRTYNQAAGDTKISCFLKFKKNRAVSKIQGTKTSFDFSNFGDLFDTLINTLISPTNFT